MDGTTDRSLSLQTGRLYEPGLDGLRFMIMSRLSLPSGFRFVLAIASVAL